MEYYTKAVDLFCVFFASEILVSQFLLTLAAGQLRRVKQVMTSENFSKQHPCKNYMGNVAKQYHPKI